MIIYMRSGHMTGGCVTVHDSMSQNESKWHLMGMESDEAEGSLQILGSNRWSSSTCRGCTTTTSTAVQNLQWWSWTYHSTWVYECCWCLCSDLLCSFIWVLSGYLGSWRCWAVCVLSYLVTSTDVTTRAQPPHTDVPQLCMDLSHGAQTFSKVGTRCTATGYMTSLLVYSPFSQELSSLSLNLIWDTLHFATSLPRDPVTECQGMSQLQLHPD